MSQWGPANDCLPPEVLDEIFLHLHHIQALFTDPVKLTVFIRDEQDEQKGLLLSQDGDYDTLLHVLNQRKAAIHEANTQQKIPRTP